MVVVFRKQSNLELCFFTAPSVKRTYERSEMKTALLESQYSLSTREDIREIPSLQLLFKGKMCRRQDTAVDATALLADDRIEVKRSDLGDAIRG